ncbi:prolyl-tRNA synthetase associated domain-containing protein [Paenibacillus camerounensis]|uniref:prolyl-tRNA synthetase associated domain-containing protein n=1 Tax=Paenibacillus camerounensis TaxID=1243663 RepID=UPI0005A68B7B|nr:YbaK/EbsC family protein [Paenibacillus camerounensis]
MKREAVIELLKQQNVSHEVIEHPAAYTIADMESFKLPGIDQIAKNLFIRDDKKRNYYLLTIQKDKSVNLKQLRTLLGLTKGAVSPFGILNDNERTVKFVLDEDLQKGETVGVHPNDNTATVWLAPEDLLSIVAAHGNEISVITL